MSVLNGLLHSFIKQYIHSLESRGSGRATAKLINDTFIEFRSSIYQLHPFDHITESYIHDIRSTHDGLHMNFSLLPVEILEQCLKDPLYRPIYQLMVPSRLCIQQTVELLKNLQSELMEQPSIKKYPNLVKLMNSILLDIGSTFYNIALDRIQELISSEESFIWTDDTSFHKLVGSCDTTKAFQQLLLEYYKTILHRIKDIIPKIIIYQLVSCANTRIQQVMYEKITQSDVSVLLEEDSGIEKRRDVLEKQRKEIQTVIKKIKEL
jgi:hypothetical protein